MMKSLKKNKPEEEKPAQDFQGYRYTDKENKVEKETEILMQVKRLLDAYPMEISESEADKINLQNVLNNSDFI